MVNCLTPSPTIKIWPYLSPAGKLWLGSIAGQLCLCDWDARPNKTLFYQHLCKIWKAVITTEQTYIIKDAQKQLDEYFSGLRKTFSLPLLMKGTDFQKEVWQELTKLPFGKTTTYSEIAKRILRENAVRAVGTAIGANPLSIFVPCHRVIGANGDLTGYAGGFLTKKILLDLEKSNSHS